MMSQCDMSTIKVKDRHVIGTDLLNMNRAWLLLLLLVCLFLAQP